MFPLISKLSKLCAPLLTAAALPVRPFCRYAPSKIVTSADIKAGDVIGFSGNGLVSGLVNLATLGIPCWGISHVGIMAHADDGRLLLFESTSLEDCPCEISGEDFSGTQAHTLDRIVKAYDGKVWRYPLYRPLFDQEDKRLTEFLMDTIHTPYDAMGAFRSGGIGLSWVESLFREQDLHMIFCSEWVAAALSYIGIIHTDNASRWNPNRLCRRLRRDELLFKPRRLR
jgi:hypothetical protein